MLSLVVNSTIFETFRVIFVARNALPALTAGVENKCKPIGKIRFVVNIYNIYIISL